MHRHSYSAHTGADTALWLGYTQGCSSGSPSQWGVYVRVSVCWVGSHQHLLILVHRVTACPSHPITVSDRWRTQPGSVCVCVCVCRSPPAVPRRRNVPQVSTCDPDGLAMFSSHLRIILLLQFSSAPWLAQSLLHWWADNCTNLILISSSLVFIGGT